MENMDSKKPDILRCFTSLFIVLFILTALFAGAEPVRNVPFSSSSEPIEPVLLPEEILAVSHEASQILTVQYVPETGSGLLSFYEKTEDGKWFLKIDSVSAWMGRNGIGKTKEGDGKTPSGIYNLTQPFGILDDPGTRLDGYVKVTDSHYWCCNSNSVYYNQLVDASVQTDFMPIMGIDERLINVYSYRYAVFIDYNAECTPKAGSAIFLHCKGSKNTTSGCIAVDFEVMEFIMKTLKPGAKIVIC